MKKTQLIWCTRTQFHEDYYLHESPSKEVRPKTNCVSADFDCQRMSEVDSRNNSRHTKFEIVNKKLFVNTRYEIWNKRCISSAFSYQRLAVVETPFVVGAQLCKYREFGFSGKLLKRLPKFGCGLDFRGGPRDLKCSIGGNRTFWRRKQNTEVNAQ